MLERYACDTTARAQGLLMSNVTVIVRKDCHMSLNSWINSQPNTWSLKLESKDFQ